MYYCSEYDNPSEEHQLLIASGCLDIEEGAVVASAQAGGIFHKLHGVTHLPQLTLMRVETATLRDAIRYADFSADMKMYEIDDFASLEQTPSAALFDDVISGDVQLKSGTVVHALDDVTVYKCLGRTYTTTDSETATSYNLVIETGSNDNTVYHVGDILTSNTSSGFLETVLGSWSTRVGTFVKTTLTGCNNLDVSKLKLSSPLANTSCIGGDNNPGLLMFDKTTQIDLNLGDVVSGRESSTIFVKVLNVRSSGSFVILEVASVDLVESGSAVTLLNPEDITEGRVVRRKRDVNVRISGGDTKSLKAGVRLIYMLYPCLMAYGYMYALSCNSALGTSSHI